MRKMTKEMPDSILLQQLGIGNESALEVLFTKYYLVLCVYCCKIVKDQELAREIVSDLFFRIWERRSLFSQKVSFIQYLFTCTKNASIDFLKKKTRETVAIRRISELSLNYDYEDPTLSSVDIDELYKQIELLPLQQKMVIKMYCEGAKSPEISSAMNITVKTVWNHKITAIAKLKSLLTK